MTKSLTKLALGLLMLLALTTNNTAKAQYYPVMNLQGGTSGTAAVLTWDQPATLIFSEGFESGIPSSWTTIDADGDGHNWTLGTYGTPHTGTGFAASASYDMGNLNPDNWLITPSIALEGTPVLYYYVSPSNASWNAEHYGVYISTTGTNPNDFTLLEEETLSITTYEMRSIDLSAYTGNVYLAWRHFDCSGMDWLCLDDIFVDSQLPLSGLTGFKVYREGEAIATLGADEYTYTDENVAMGYNNYCVTALYGTNESEMSCVEVAYMGPCTPPVSLTATQNNDGSVSLAWEAPEIEVTGYKVYRDGSCINITDASTLTYSDVTTYNGSHEYCVAATYDLCTSESTCADVVVTNSTNCSYRIVMHKNSAPTGTHGWEGAFIMFMNNNNQTLTTCSLDNELDYDEVTIGFPHEHVNCYWMSGADDYWINFEIYDYNDALIFEGWGHNLNGLFFDFTPACSMDNPASCESFTATGATDALESYLKWTNPSTTIGGDPVVLTSVVILRDGEIVETIANPTAGAEITWTDETPCAGEYSYSIYAVSEAGPGAMTSDIDTVGMYNIIPYSGHDNVTSHYGFVRCELDNIGLYPTGYDGQLTLRPAEEGQFMHIEGIHYIYDGSYGGDPDHLYVYDGEDTNGTLLADLTNSCFDDKSGERGTLDVTSVTGALTLHFVTGQMGGCRGLQIYTSLSDVANVGESDENENIEIYPNPAHDVIYIEGENIGLVEMYNALGQRVFMDENINKIHVSNYPSGIYVIKSENVTKRVVIR